MVRQLLRDSGFQSVLTGLGIGVALLAAGIGVLLAVPSGDERTIGWGLVLGGGVLCAIFAWLVGVLLYEYALDDASKRIELQWPFRMPIHVAERDSSPSAPTTSKTLLLPNVGIPLEVVRDPEPLDERLVLLCNSYAVPAMGALQIVQKSVFDQCFADGGWAGLSARYFRDYVFEPNYSDALNNLHNCIDGKSSNGDLENAFIRYCGIYLVAGAFLWHASRLGVLGELKAITGWVKRHEALIEQVTILSGGINRDGLKRFLMLNHEYVGMPRDVLKKAQPEDG